MGPLPCPDRARLLLTMCPAEQKPQHARAQYAQHTAAPPATGTAPETPLSWHTPPCSSAQKGMPCTGAGLRGTQDAGEPGAGASWGSAPAARGQIEVIHVGVLEAGMCVQAWRHTCSEGTPSTHGAGSWGSACRGLVSCSSHRIPAGREGSLHPPARRVPAWVKCSFNTGCYSRCTHSPVPSMASPAEQLLCPWLTSGH